MNGVMGMTELLLESGLTEPQRRLAQTVESSAGSLLSVINDVLDFSKIEAGKLTLETVDVELHDVIEDAVAPFAERAHRKGLELICSIDSDVPTRVRGDANRLRQILTNLVGNAVKFTRDGEVGVWVTATQESQGRSIVRFEVRDTGIGIPMERRSDVFRHFQQADGSTTREFGGTGLGLAISRQLTELMGGQIGVESTPGEGSTFWFTVSLEHTYGTVRSLAPAQVLTGRRVLIVDDNETNRTILEAQAASWAMRPSCASSGHEGLDMMRQAAERDDPFTCVILDLQMPTMDGLQIAEAIRAERSYVQPVVLLLTSALLSPEQTASTLGIEACLEKPVRRSSLYNALLSCLATPTGSPAVVDEGPEARPHFGARILVAEDTEVNQAVATKMLSALGCTAKVAVNGRQAIELWSASHYDLILMDCQMPELDGYEATRAIRQREQEAASTVQRGDSVNSRIPIVALTAHAMSHDREACLAAGMDDHLSKPFTKQALATILRQWLPEVPTGQQSSDSGQQDDPSPEPAVDPVLDPVALDELRALDDEGPPVTLREVLTLYLEESSRLMTQLERAVETVDVETVTTTAHALKSMSGNVGARGLSKLYERLVQLGHANTTEPVVQTFCDIKAEHSAVRAAISQVLHESAEGAMSTAAAGAK